MATFLWESIIPQLIFKEMKIIKKIKWSTLGYALCTVGLLFFMASLVAVYFLPRTNETVKKIVNVAPYPLVVINYKNIISYRTLAENMASIKRFYETQDFSQVGLRVDFSTKEGLDRFKVREKEVLNKMIEDEAIMLLAKERGITVTDTAAREGLKRQLDEYGSGSQVKDNLTRLYGWTLDQFENKVVLPSMYEERLRTSFENEVETASKASEIIHQAQEALRSGKNFFDIARQYSQGQTAKEGGELGWFAEKDLVPELRSAVMTQKIGVVGDIVESSMGFHILVVEEIKKENDKQLYRVKQIFARKVSFADWLTEQMKKLTVYVLSLDYRWNSEDARAEFKSQTMQDLENNILEKTSGDALFFF